MKRCFNLILIIFTLVLSFSGCTVRETEFTLSDFESTVSFTLPQGRIKGNLVFLKDKEISFTVVEPEIVENTVFRYINTETTLEYDGVTSEVLDSSVVHKLFSVLCHFSDEVHKISTEGIQTMECSMNGTDYEVVLNCTERKIEEIHIGSAFYLFQ